MMNSKTSMSALVQSLSLAVAGANERLHTEYISAAERMRENGRETLVTLPPPLSISGARVSFTAHVSKADRVWHRENGGELMLDFNKPGGNFRGEIEFRPYDPDRPGDPCSENEDQPEDTDEAFPVLSRQNGIMNEIER